ncbi:MAG: MFS transporter, partial [Acidimicrobiia bacterium]
MDELTRRNPALPSLPPPPMEEPTRRNPVLPFIPTPEEVKTPTEKSPFRVFGTKAFFRLWVSQVFSSTGDWVGLTATLVFARKLSGGSEYALSGVLVSKLLPGLVFGSLALVLLDRFDKKLLMVGSDLARVVLYASLPFVNNLALLFVVSFLAEIFTLVWGAAKDASIPQLVEGEALQSANSLGLAASYGTLPLAGLVYAGLAALASTSLFSNLTTNTNYLAIWFDALTYLVSALVVLRLPLRSHRSSEEKHKLDWTQTYREAREGLHFIRTHRLVRSVFIGLGGGMIGGGAMIPLGQLYATDVLGDSKLFGVLETALGVGATIGVVSLLILQKWLPREPVFALSLITTGGAIIGAACFSLPTAVMVLNAVVGAAAGTAYV